MSTATGEPFGEHDPSDARGDVGDQAQDLRAAMEQEAIEAALAGRRGDDDLERPAASEPLEGPDPEEGLLEGDASDDPVYGGDEITGIEPLGDLALEVADDEGLTEAELDASEGLDDARPVELDDADRG